MQQLGSDYSPIYAWIIRTTEEANRILLSGGKIIVISETIPEYLSSPQFGSSCLSANDLLPDYGAVSSYIDGDKEGFVNKHFALLDSQACTIYFATIIAAIVNSIPLGFVFGTEEIEAEAAQNILYYMNTKFGIILGLMPEVVGAPNAVGTSFMHSSYVAPNFVLLYMNNLLTAGEFLQYYPVIVPIPIMTINKLAAELQPVVSNPYDINCYVEYFEAIRKLSGAGKPLVDPLVR